MADKYPSLSPYNYCASNPLIYTDPTGCEIDSNEVKGDEAYKELKESEKGQKYLSEFEEDGKHQDSKLQLTNKYETVGDGQMETGYYDKKGNWQKGLAPDGVQQVLRVFVGSQLNSTNKTSVSFGKTVTTYLHEVQHAVTEAGAIQQTGAPTVNGEHAISTYEHTVARYSLMKNMNNKYNYNLTSKQVLRSVTSFVGFSPKIFRMTMPKYK